MSGPSPVLAIGGAIVIHVAGVPRPLPRPRFVAGRVIAIADKRARAWKAAVEAACRKAGRLGSGAVAARVWCYFPTKRAERWGAPHTARPDADNLAKMMLDCAERAGTLPRGDARVARLETVKQWAKAGAAIMELRPYAENN